MTNQPTPSNSAVQFKDVTCKVAGRTILENISLEIAQGGITGILGPNGAGKSTLLSLANGLRTHFSGQLTVLGCKMPESSAKQRARIGVVLQETALYEELTTYENLQFSAALYNIPDSKKRIFEVLELLMLKDREKQIVRTLSGGLRRRVAIARALLHDPELLIIDEPTLGVDVEARHAIWSHLRLLKSKGRTTIVASNYLDEVQALCDKVAVLRDGKLLTYESPEFLVARTGNCLDVECKEESAASIVEFLNEKAAGILRTDLVPGGLTVFLESRSDSKQIMNLLLQCSTVSGFRLRAPDLVEVFKSLEAGT